MYTFGKSRSINVAKLFALVQSVFEQDSWPLDSVLLYCGTAVSNMVEHFAGFLNPKKSYIIGEGKFTGAHLLTLVEKYDTDHEGQAFPVICSGDHRATAILLLALTGQREVEPVMQEIREDDDAKLVALGGNGRHANVAKLERIDAVKQVIACIADGSITSESDLQNSTGQTRYQAIVQWQTAELVRLHGIDIEKACSLSQGQLAEVRKASDPAEEVEKVLTEKVEKVKAMNQKDQQELFNLAESKGASLELLGLLNAIRTNGKGIAQNMILDMING